MGVLNRTSFGFILKFILMVIIGLAVLIVLGDLIEEKSLLTDNCEEEGGCV